MSHFPRFILSLIFASWFVASSAHATLTHTCYVPGHFGEAWFQPESLNKGITVPVYVSTAYCDNGQGTLVNFSPMNATGLSLTDLAGGVARALNVWNEEGGSGLKLRYMGTINSCLVSGAVLITGRTDKCVAGAAAAFPNIHPTTHLYLNGTIEFRKYTGGSGPGGCSPQITWTTAPILGFSAQEGFVRTLVHELGHQVFNIGDVSTTPPGTDCENFGGPSAMSYSSAPTQTLSNWDLEVVQRRYIWRSNYSRIYRSAMNTSTSWWPAVNLPQDGYPNYKRPLFRMGSMTLRTNPRVLGWVYGPLSVQDGGAGRLDFTQYYSGTTPTWNSLTGAGGTLGRPIAVTSNWATGTILIAYFKRHTAPLCNGLPCTIYQTAQAMVCYRLSTNGGTVWGSETCGSDYSVAYGLTATYDSRSASFLVAWTSSTWGVKVLRIPTVTGQPAASITSLPVSSPHAPSIACSGNTAGECVLAYQTADSAGILGYLKVHVNTAGSIVINSSHALGYQLYDTPGIVYDDDYASYRLAFTQRGAAIYTLKMALGTSSWSISGDVFNNDSSYVSTGILNTRTIGAFTSRPYSWFVKYW